MVSEGCRASSPTSRRCSTRRDTGDAELQAAADDPRRAKRMTHHTTAGRSELAGRPAGAARRREGADPARGRAGAAGAAPGSRSSRTTASRPRAARASLADLPSSEPELAVDVPLGMFSPSSTAGCPACSAIATASTARRPPRAPRRRRWSRLRVRAHRRRRTSDPRGGSRGHPRLGSDFNLRLQRLGNRGPTAPKGDHHFYQTADMSPRSRPPTARSSQQVAATCRFYTREAPGMSAFALEDGVLYHTYSAYAPHRGMCR